MPQPATHTRSILARNFAFAAVLSLSSISAGLQADVGAVLDLNGQIASAENRWTAIRVLLQTEREDFVGRIVVHDLSRDRSVVQCDVRLPAPSSKVYVLYVPPGYLHPFVQVEIRDRRGRRIERYQKQVRQLSPSEELIALVFPTGTEAPRLALPEKRSTEQTTTLAQLPVDRLPDSGFGLNSASVVVLADPSLAGAAPEAVEALRQYVALGGILLVYGGREMGLPLVSPLADLLPIEAVDRVNVHPWDAMARWSRSDAPPPEADLYCTRFQPLGAVLLADGNLPLVVTRRYGCGRVVAVAADLGSRAFTDWAGAEAFVRAAIEAGDDQAFRLVESSPFLAEVHAPNPWQTVYQGLPGEIMGFVFRPLTGQRVQMAWVMGVLIVYLLVLGPANYAVLRARGMLFWSWLTVPGVVGLTTLIIWAWGLSIGSSTFKAHTIALVRAAQGARDARVDGVTGLVSPRRRMISLAAPDLRATGFHRIRRDWQHDRREEVDGLVEGRTTLEALPRSPELVAHTGVLDLGGTIEADLAFDGNAILGQITNRTAYRLGAVRLLLAGADVLLAATCEVGQTMAVHWRGCSGISWQGSTPDRIELALAGERDEIQGALPTVLRHGVRGGPGRLYLAARLLDDRPLALSDGMELTAAASLLLVRLDEVGLASAGPVVLSEPLIRVLTESEPPVKHVSVAKTRTEPLPPDFDAASQRYDPRRAVYQVPMVRREEYVPLRLQVDPCGQPVSLWRWTVGGFVPLQASTVMTDSELESFLRPGDGMLVESEPTCLIPLSVEPARGDAP